METVITISVLCLTGVTMVSVLSGSLNVYSRGESGTNAVNSATIALQRLSNDIRDGRSATVNSGVLTVRYPATVTDPSTGEKMYDLSAQDPVAHLYYLSNGNLVRSVNSSVTTIARGISSVTWGASGGSINVTITGTAQTGSKVSNQQVVGRITMRNYRY